MAGKAEEILSAGAGLVAVLVVGVAVLAARADISADRAVVVAWWVAYLLYLGVFVLGADLIRRRPPWSPLVTVVLMFTTSSILWLMAPHLGWTALLPVVTTAVAAFDLSSRAVVALVAAQSVVIPVGGVLAGWEADDVVFQTPGVPGVPGVRRARGHHCQEGGHRACGTGGCACRPPCRHRPSLHHQPRG